MLKRLFLILILVPVVLFAQAPAQIKVGSFNAEWFPCKDDGTMMKQYGINLRYPPTGNATDIPAMFNMLKQLDLQLLGVVEVVDTKMMAESAAKYLGKNYKFIYAPATGSQKVGFVYNASVLKLVGQPVVYSEVTLKPGSWLRPAFRADFRVLPNGMDFHAIIAHLKAAPSGWKKRDQQWRILGNILKNLKENSPDKDIVLMGDFNNVSKNKYNEFKPLMEKLGFYWATSELVKKQFVSDYWKPDFNKERIEGSLIDQIFLSPGMMHEYEKGSTRVGGMCADGKNEYKGSEIPEYYETISDHCPVYFTLHADKDDD